MKKWSQSVREQLNFHCELPKRAKRKYLVMSHYFTSILQSARNLHSLCGTFSSLLPLRQNKICGIEKPNTKTLRDHTHRTPFKKITLWFHTAPICSHITVTILHPSAVFVLGRQVEVRHATVADISACFHHFEHILTLYPKSPLLTPPGVP